MVFGNKLRIISQKGQGTVEYILLLAVVVSISFLVFRSPIFQNFFGADSSAFLSLTKFIEHCYRHGGSGQNTSYSNAYRTNGIHWSYTKGNRFFGPKNKYPD